MNTLCLTTSVTALANAIACNVTADELALLAAVFVQLGDTMATIVAQRNLCTDQSNIPQDD